MLKLQVDNGRIILKAELQKDPGNAAALIMANYADFLELCVQQDPERYVLLLRNQEQRLEIIESHKNRNAWDDYAAAEVRMHLAMSKLLFGNRLSAAWDFRKAYVQYADNARRWPSFVPNKKNLGVLQILLGSVPDQYTWFLNIIGLEGSVKRGMTNLTVAATTKNPFQEEAQLLHALVLHLLEQEEPEQAVTRATSLARANPDNLLFHFAAMHLLKKTKQSDAALYMYHNRPVGKEYLQFPFLHHMAADLYLFRGDYDTSIQKNQLFLKQHKGKHYLKATLFKLYLAYLLYDHTPQAKWHFNRIAETGIAETEEDKYAVRYVEDAEEPVLPLLRARLHADGGYYIKALQDLKQMKLTTALPLPVRAEYFYRKGRIYHGLEDLQEAIAFYKKTIDVSGTSDLYFAPNASLQLGYIYLNANEPAKAKAYFKQALSYKGHPYKNSIDTKAKLALSDL
ncbi:tetratricopeptide repeat protein [Pontibacter toksunensis]|uniref:Tetratricopeptide repeat protein n=2 Tax=Pontibacter toksunensis TaxID=1332631 RepID=A0ABW6BML1_9BACT